MNLAILLTAIVFLVVMMPRAGWLRSFGVLLAVLLILGLAWGASHHRTRSARIAVGIARNAAVQEAAKLKVRLRTAAAKTDGSLAGPAEQDEDPAGATTATSTTSNDTSKTDGVDTDRMSAGKREETEPEPSQAPAAASTSRELSRPVGSVTHVRYLSENRPTWLESGPSVNGDVHTIAVKAGPYSRVQQCLRDLDEELRRAANDFTNEHLENPHAAELVGYNLKEIKAKLVGERFEEQLETSVGLMNQVHALLTFDAEFRRDIEGRWDRVKAASRLLQTGLGGGIVLLLLGTLFAYFKLDTATRGYYTGRLQFAAAAAILGLVAASILIAKWIPWM